MPSKPKLTLAELIKHFEIWLKEKVTGTVTINLHEGGIRDAKIERHIK
jgi:hypothetical protein